MRESQYLNLENLFMMFLLHFLLHAVVYSAQSNIEPHPKHLSTCDAIEMGGHKQRIFSWDDPLVPSEKNSDVTELESLV